MIILPADLDDPRVGALLAHHRATASAATAPGSAHALDADELRDRDVTVWAAWENEELLAVGALQHLSPEHGEIKSMHTVEAARRRGIGKAMLRHIIGAARGMGMSRLSLETGSWDYFRPARQLYRSHGFIECPPFGDYGPDPNSVFMSLSLR